MDRTRSGILRASTFAVVLAAGVWAAPLQVAMGIGFTVRTVAVMGEQMPGVDPGVTSAIMDKNGGWTVEEAKCSKHTRFCSHWLRPVDWGLAELASVRRAASSAAGQPASQQTDR